MWGGSEDKEEDTILLETSQKVNFKMLKNYSMLSSLWSSVINYNFLLKY